ncbi:MAG TPA: hypothetical protein VFH58_01055 [Acidimicrobiales bacterium]|nr:hypothetical protein [Acidimicrobiales bacterium]
MTGTSTRRRRAAVATAIAAMVGMPLLGFMLAPSASADDSPGANLAGINGSASASAVEVAPLTPGLVGAGNVSQGNLLDASIPYASSSISTGPSSSAVGSPAYPGDTAAGAGNAIATFAPQFPSALVDLLNYPVLARADYPAQVSVGSSSNYSPPGGSTAGVGTASAQATDSGSKADAATSRTAFSAAGVSVATSTASSKTVLGSSSVTATSHTDVGTVEILGGLVKIAGITSDASATSDGNQGQPTSDFKLGAVTVGGMPASIGPDGVTVGSNGQGGSLIPDANQALVALKQAGISMYTVAPSTTFDGASASVTSGALVITFQDANIPNPNGQVPLSSIGLELNLGVSQATADATALPPLGNLPPLGGTDVGSPTGSADAGALAGAAPGGPVAVSPPGGTGTAGSASMPSMAAAPASAPGSAGTNNPPQAAPPVISPPQTLLGAPIKVAWVVIAFLLSLVVSGPLLGYANWQLLRGRKS